MQNQEYEKIYSENKYFWSATLYSLQNAWMTNLAKIFEDSSYSEENKIISVFALILYQKQNDNNRAKKVVSILQKNKSIIKNICILRNNQLAHNNARHLLNPKNLLKRYPIKYAKAEKLLKISSEILSYLNPEKGHGYHYDMLIESCDRDIKYIIEKFKFFYTEREKHLNKFKDGLIDDPKFPPNENSMGLTKENYKK